MVAVEVNPNAISGGGGSRDSGGEGEMWVGAGLVMEGLNAEPHPSRYAKDELLRL